MSSFRALASHPTILLPCGARKAPSSLHDTATILFARLHLIAAAIWSVAIVTDLSPLLPPKYVTSGSPSTGPSPNLTLNVHTDSVTCGPEVFWNAVLVLEDGPVFRGPARTAGRATYLGRGTSRDRRKAVG